MTGRVTWPAALLAASLAGIACSLWLGTLPGLFVSVFAAGLAAAWLRPATRHAGEREDARLIGELWKVTRRLPDGSTFEDPLTGRGISVSRSRGFLTLDVVDDLNQADEDMLREALVKSYMLGFLGRPVPPPAYRRTIPLADDEPKLGWRQAARMIDFGIKTAADDATTEELKELQGIVGRAISAGPVGGISSGPASRQ
jgi:hypothetical protein